MAPNWFIVKPDRELGPYTSAQMKQLASSGQLKTENLLRKADQTTPVAAGNLQELFPQVQAPDRPETPPPPLPSETTNNDPIGTSGPPPLPSNRTKFDDIRKTLGDLTETTKAAGHLAVAEVRKAKLTHITLPSGLPRSGS